MYPWLYKEIKGTLYSRRRNILRANSFDLIKVSSKLYRRPVFTVVGTDLPRMHTEICVRDSRQLALRVYVACSRSSFVLRYIYSRRNLTHTEAKIMAPYIALHTFEDQYASEIIRKAAIRNTAPSISAAKTEWDVSQVTNGSKPGTSRTETKHRRRRCKIFKLTRENVKPEDSCMKS